MNKRIVYMALAGTDTPFMVVWVVITLNGIFVPAPVLAAALALNSAAIAEIYLRQLRRKK